MQTVKVVKDARLRPSITDAELARIERMFRVARRVKDIRQSIEDYSEMHKSRIAAMHCELAKAESELASLTVQP